MNTLVAELVHESVADAATLVLSREDQGYLQSFDMLLQLIRMRTRSVALGFQNGAYLVGRPGAGKTETVMDELAKLKVAHTLRNSRMTSKGLYRLLEANPESVIILDDIPALHREVYAQQTLLAALGGRPGEARKVTLTTAEADGMRSTQFSGGIIAISNVPLRRDPLADAIQSRVPLLEHEPSDEMLAAAMRAAVIKGYKDVPADECMGVVDYAIEQMRNCDYRLDLRIRQRALEDYRLWRMGESDVHWEILVNSTIKRFITGDSTNPMSKAEEKALERDLALKLFKEHPTTEVRDQAWVAQTGKSVDTLYRRLRELKAQGLLR